MTDQATTVGANTRIQGNIEGEDDLLVIGRVEGSISITGSLLVDAEAVVAANIRAAQVTIHGTVQGDIQATEMIQITAEGRVAGDISTPRVAIEEGAQFTGNVEMGEAEARGHGEEAPPRALTATEKKKPAPKPLRARGRSAPSGVKAKKPTKQKLPALAKTKATAKKPAPKARAGRAPKPPTKAGKKIRARRK